MLTSNIEIFIKRIHIIVINLNKKRKYVLFFKLFPATFVVPNRMKVIYITYIGSKGKLTNRSNNIIKTVKKYILMT